MQFTFEWSYCNSDWIRSGRRFTDWISAMNAASGFASILYENGEVCSIRVIEVEP